MWPWLTEGCWWGLHPKKGSLSRWQHQDWQDVILHGNSVSQPVSLPVRQPLTPLNLAFCWAVTRLVTTLHGVDLINCTKKVRQRSPSPSWTLCATTLRLETSLMAVMTKTPLSHLPFLLYLCVTRHPIHRSGFLLCWANLLQAGALAETQKQSSSIVLPCWICRLKAWGKERSLQHFLCSHIVNPFL